MGYRKIREYTKKYSARFIFILYSVPHATPSLQVFFALIRSLFTASGENGVSRYKVVHPVITEVNLNRLPQIFTFLISL